MQEASTVPMSTGTRTNSNQFMLYVIFRLENFLMLNNNEVQDSGVYKMSESRSFYENAKQESERKALEISLPLIQAYNLLMSLLPITLDSVCPCTSRGIYSLNSVLPEDLFNITGY